MAEDQDARTEAPTGKRLAEADAKGQVAYSAELSQAILMLAGVGLVIACGNDLATVLKQCLRDQLKAPPLMDLDVQTTASILIQMSGRVLPVVAPILFGLVAIAAAVGYLQIGGITFRPQVLEVHLDRLDPIAGSRRLFAPRALLRIVISLAKLAIVGGIAYGACDEAVQKLSTLGRAPLRTTMVTAFGIALKILMRIGIALLVIGALDYLYQRWQFIRDLKMTKEEVKDEAKQSERSPEVRSRQRKAVLEMRRRRMFRDIPQATAVVTNPTHYAVAIRYRRPGGLDPADDAPVVVAKGADLIAKRIREIATSSGVPIVENPPLARALYRTTEIGTVIPPDMYRAVAEVLAFVFRLKRQTVGV